MTFERITDPKHAMLPAAAALYEISFPRHEQRLPASQERIFSDPEYKFLLIRDGGEFAGLLLCWENDDFVYVEHFCILPELRGRGLGERALAGLCAQGKSVILEIDPPVDEISRRRRGFYERCGFVENGFDYVHLPYRPDTPGHKLVIMSYPAQISRGRFDEFCAYLLRRVMKNAFSAH
mgnify:CR=1 FL=1